MAHWKSPYHSIILILATLTIPIFFYYTVLVQLDSHSISLYYYSTGPLTGPHSTLISSFGPLIAPISLYYTLLANWQSLYHSTILFWPTGSPHINLMNSTYWLNESPYITLLHSAFPLAVSVSLYYSLLTHWQLLFYSTMVCWHSYSHYITLLILYLAHWQSLYQYSVYSTGQMKVSYSSLYYHSNGPTDSFSPSWIEHEFLL